MEEATGLVGRARETEHPSEGFVGRAREAEHAREVITKGSNLLVAGRAGIGKSAFLAHLWASLPEATSPPLWVPVGTTKHVLLELARQIHERAGLRVPEATLPVRLRARAKRAGWLPWSDLRRTLFRLPVTDTTEIVMTSMEGRGFLVFADSLEMPPSQADAFAKIVDQAQVVAALDTDNRRVRIERLLWRFPERVELRPLPLAETEALVCQQLQQRPLRFAGERTRRTFVRHLARDSHGSPAAVRGMIQAAAAEDEITPAKARAFTHEAGVRYLDMTPAVVIGLVGFIALRYIARGINEVEMLVLSGVASALFMGLRFFMFRMSRGAGTAR